MRWRTQPWVRRLRRCAVIKKAERAYWSIASTLPVNAAGTGIMSQMSPLLIDRGMSPATAAWLLSVFATSVLFSRLGRGWLIDHFSPRIRNFCSSGRLRAAAVGRSEHHDSDAGAPADRDPARCGNRFGRLSAGEDVRFAQLRVGLRRVRHLARVVGFCWRSVVRAKLRCERGL